MFYGRSVFTGAHNIGSLFLLALKVLSASKTCGCVYEKKVILSYRHSGITGAHILLALFLVISNAKCASNRLFSSCHRNGEKNSFRNICTPENILKNILTFLNHTNPFCKHKHPYTNIVHFLHPDSNKTVQGSWDSY